MTKSDAPTATPTHERAVVWIDHLTARIFSMGLTGVSPATVHAHLASSHLHHKANTIGAGRVEEDPAFLAGIAEALRACNNLLIVGPGNEKTALMHYLKTARPDMAVKVEAMDHPSDHEIIAIGKRHFHLDGPRIAE
jgi:stalled ribosome rescue protein Dom34